MVTEIGAKIVTEKLAIGPQIRVHSEPVNRPPQELNIAPRSPPLSKAQILEPAMVRAPAPDQCCMG